MNTTNLRFRSNRVRDVISLYHEELDGMYGNGEVGVFVEMLFDAFLGWGKVRLLTSKEQTVDQSDLLRFHWALEDLKKHRPIQHIIGYTDFCGCRIKVNPDVLIPRPETEEMVNSLTPGPSPHGEGSRILDLCTGSGCIAIALKKAFPAAEVTAVDVSPKALEMARQNAQNNGVEVRFVEADVLEGIDGLKGQYGLIVSNPPYVRDSERAQMAANVLDYDPALALFVPDDDPLRFYKAIATIAKEHLAEDGLLVVEINEALAYETSALLKDYGFSPEVHTDFRGKARWVSARKTP
jgi:release factor glutamine methyltransferase